MGGSHDQEMRVRLPLHRYHSQPFGLVRREHNQQGSTMKQVFQTDDGTVFETAVAALKHESDLMQDWLDDSVVGQWVTEVLETMDNESQDEYFGTERDMGDIFRLASYRLSLAKLERFKATGQDFGEFIERLLSTEDEDEEQEINDCFILSDN